jgi:hypothetical protein
LVWLFISFIRPLAFLEYSILYDYVKEKKKELRIKNQEWRHSGKNPSAEHAGGYGFT